MKTKEQQAQEYVLNRQTVRHNAKPEEEATMADFDKTRKAWDAYDMEQAFEDGYTACEQSQWRSVEEAMTDYMRNYETDMRQDDVDAIIEILKEKFPDTNTEKR